MTDFIDKIWSCDPKLIQPWTEEDVERLHKTLKEIFKEEQSLSSEEEKLINDNISTLYED